MKSLSTFAALLALPLLLLLPACSEDEQPQKATLVVQLTDAIAPYDAVRITFSEVSAHIDNNWVNVSALPKTVDLLQWNNGKTIEIGRNDLPAGKYTQLRLLLTKCELDVGGQTYPVSIQSEDQTGLKMNIDQTMVEGSTYEMVIDFDANKSIVQTGNGQYKIKPVLRAVPRAMTGSISGMVTNFDRQPLAIALQGPNEVTSTPVDRTTGQFRLAFLPPGTYDLLIDDATDRHYQRATILVESGKDVSVGTVTLY
jgi:hypothetical protein